MNRRVFLKNSAIAMFGIGSTPLWLARAAAAESTGRRKILVVVFLRGAADGLNMVVPHGDPRYYKLRPGIAVPRANVLDLDGFYGLHPSLVPLQPLYQAGQLAVVEAAGSPDPTRSHFDAQDYMESGTPGRKSTSDGWLNRALVPSSKTSPVRAVALGAQLPRCLQGDSPAVAIGDLARFRVGDIQAHNAFESMYADAVDRVLGAAGKQTFEAVRMVEAIGKRAYVAQNGAAYPNGRFARSMQQIACLIKADVGLEVAFADIGGWDTHVNQVGQLNVLLNQWGGTLAAFHRDLGERMQDIVVVTMSEFGRTARENGNRGTDHGHANVMFVLGSAVHGGQIYGRWPGLQQEQLYDGRDLAVTTDFRTVLAELVNDHLGAREISKVFPGFRAEKNLGLLANKG